MNGARKTCLGFAVVVLSVIATAATGFASQNGKHQSVAINDRGTFVEVHIAGDTGTNNLWFNLGTISAGGASPGKLCLVQNGQVPAQAWNMTDSDFKTPWTSVALSGQNVVILFPGSSGNNDIWCVTGTIETTESWNFVPKSITWNTAQRLTGSIAKHRLPEYLWGPVQVDYYYVEGAENPSFMLRFLLIFTQSLPSNCCCGDDWEDEHRCSCGTGMTDLQYFYQQWRLSDLKGDTENIYAFRGDTLENAYQTLDIQGTGPCSTFSDKWGIRGPSSVGYAGNWGDVFYYIQNWEGAGFSYFTTNMDGFDSAITAYYYSDRGGNDPTMTTVSGSSFISRLAATDYSGNFHIGVFPIYKESDWEKIADYFKKSSEVMSGKAQQVCSAIGDIFASIDYWTGDSYKIYSITSIAGVKTYTNYLGGGERPTCAVNRDGVIMEVHMDAKAGSDELWFHFGFIDSVSTTWSGSHSFPKGPFLYEQGNWYCVDLN